MGFFFSKTWYWWVLATIVACILTWLVCWLRNRRLDDEAAARDRELAQSRLLVGAHEQRIESLLAQRAKDLDELSALRAGGGVAGAAGLAGVAGPAGVATLAGLPAAALSPDQLAAGGTVLGFRLQADDLKVVEGIGPAIESLLHNAGITTWRELQQTDTARIREVLEAAGPRFKMHDPGSWPRQAGLLADGQWEAFKTLTDELLGGR